MRDGDLKQFGLRRHQKRVLVLFVVSFTFSMLALTATAQTGGFEIDASQTPPLNALYSGNDQNNGVGDDWAQGTGTGHNGLFTSSADSPHTAAEDCYDSNIDINPAAAGVTTLICDGNSDTKFSGNQPIVSGGEAEQNVVSPSGKSPDDKWPIKPGNVRPKNDFSHAYVNAVAGDSPCDDDGAAGPTGELNDDIFLRLGGHVGDNEGSHFWGFEFDKTPPGGFNSLKANDGSSFTLDYNRQLKDLLISFTVPGSTNEAVQLQVFTVNGFIQSGNDAGDAIFGTPAANSNCPSGQPQGQTKLDTNQTNDVEAPPWNVPVCDPTHEAGGINDNNNSCRVARGGHTDHLLAPRDFAEANVDLTAFGITNVCFTNVIFSSRSAHVLEGADVQDVGGKDFPLCGKKAGLKFHDRNADGVRQASTEPVIAGWPIRLYQDTGTTPDALDSGDVLAASTTTGSDGKYQFTNLAAGEYLVCEAAQHPGTGGVATSGWNESLPNVNTTGSGTCTFTGGPANAPYGYAFTMTGADHLNNDFGNYRNGTISGTKFKDADADGNDKESGETGLGGWIIHVFNSGFHTTTTTASDGTWSVSVAPGTYTVCEETTGKTGWVQSFPGASGQDCSGHTHAGLVIAGRGHSITVLSEGTSSGTNFGNTPLSNITVTFNPLADLPNGNDATKATAISCKAPGASGSSVGSNTNSNTLTTDNVKTNQSTVVCTITFEDP